jgi:hypothetical protein
MGPGDATAVIFLARPSRFMRTALAGVPVSVTIYFGGNSQPAYPTPTFRSSATIG